MPDSHRKVPFCGVALAFGRTGVVGPGRQWRVCVGFGLLRLGTDDLAHGLVEAQAEDLDEEVDGVAGLVTLGPAPIAILDDQTGKGGQKEIARSLVEQLQPPPLE